MSNLKYISHASEIIKDFYQTVYVSRELLYNFRLKNLKFSTTSSGNEAYLKLKKDHLVSFV